MSAKGRPIDLVILLPEEIAATVIELREVARLEKLPQTPERDADLTLAMCRALKRAADTFAHAIESDEPVIYMSMASFIPCKIGPELLDEPEAA